MANKNSKLNISALILAKNEQQVLESCLKQLDFVKEIIVLDQNSTDNTKKIAKKYASKIISSNSDNFAKNRNILATAAGYEWLFYLDPDERIDDKLKEEIKKAVKEGVSSTYYIPRKNIVLGKWLKHGGWWPDYVPRLFKKRNLITWYGEVHESPRFKGEAFYLKNAITHLTARSLDQMLGKSVVWGQVEARLYHKANYPNVTIFKLIIASSKEFTRRYFLKLGFLDGTVGLIQAIYQALHQTIILVYLWEIQNDYLEKFNEVSNE